MEQRHSGEANRFPASEDIPKIIWNLKVHYRVYKYLLHVTIRNQINQVHAPLSTSWRPILILFSYLLLGLPRGLFS